MRAISESLWRRGNRFKRLKVTLRSDGMEEKQDGQKRKIDNAIKKANSDEVTDPRQLLEELLKRTEEMEKRLARILEDCENLGVFDDARRERRGSSWSRLFGR